MLVKARIKCDNPKCDKTILLDEPVSKQLTGNQVWIKVSVFTPSGNGTLEVCSFECLHGLSEAVKDGKYATP